MCDFKASMSLDCMICSKPADRNDLVCPRDHASWWSLFDAAEIRGFRPILQLSGAAENVPEVFFIIATAVFRSLAR